MPDLRHGAKTCTALVGLAMMAGLPLAANGAPPTPKHIIFTFAPAADGTYPGGENPIGELIADSQGRLYGVTILGGQFNFGVVYRLTRPTTGNGEPWTEEVLHNFNEADGGDQGPLLLGSAGELYGTTVFGGSKRVGSIYRLDNVPGWPLTVLHNFASFSDGAQPVGSLQFGPGGLLYGVTRYGGHTINGVTAGTIFSVSTEGDATEYAVLHRFAELSAKDGGIPPGGLTPGGPDRFYGLTTYGGDYGKGTAFVFTLNSANQWIEKPIFMFGGPSNDLDHPYYQIPPMASGPGGVLYGCATNEGMGAVFSLTPPGLAGGSWTETDIYDFGTAPGVGFSDANNCNGVTREPSGQLVGNSYLRAGGAVFQISPPASGLSPWRETLLHHFTRGTSAGYDPLPGLLRLGGEYFGATYEGGANYPSDAGTVFSFKP